MQRIISTVINRHHCDLRFHSSRPRMANVTGMNSTNIANKLPNATVESETKNTALEASYIATIIINSITCPITVLLNVLVIMAVKRRPRLQNNANILLAYLAATDALTGVLTQPSFVAWKISQLVGFFIRFGPPFRVFGHNLFIRILSVCSTLHLVLVTCDRLIAIKFTMKYYDIVTKQKIKVAVISCWVLSVSCVLFKYIRITRKFSDLLVAIVLVMCILFIATVYVVLYLETRRHNKVIKTQQLPQDQVDRFARESKALKTAVYVVGAVAICFLPMGFTFLSYMMKWPIIIPSPWVRTLAVLNSLLNPLIYCWRQTEMRKYVFRMRAQGVYPAN